MTADRQRRIRGAGLRARALFLIFALAFAGAPAAAGAQESAAPASPPTVQQLQQGADSGIWDEWDREAGEAERVIAVDGVTPDALDAARTNLEADRVAAKAVSDAAAAEVARLNKELDALGPAPADGEAEPADAAKLRADLQKRISGARAIQVRADRVVARAQDLLTRVAGVSQQRFIARMTTLGPSPVNPAHWFSALKSLQAVTVRIGDEIGESLADPEAATTLRERAPIVLVAFGAAILIWFGLRGLVFSLMRRAAESVGRRTDRLVFAIGAALARFVTLLMVAAGVMIGVSATGLAGEVGAATLRGVGFGLGQFIGIYVLSATFFSSRSAALRIALMDDRQAARGHRAALLIGLALLIDSVLTGPAEAMGVETASSAVASFIPIMIGAVGLWRMAALARDPIDPSETDDASRQFRDVLRRTIWAVAIGAPLLSLIGYEAAARYIFFPFVHTLMLYGLVRLILRAVSEAVDIRIENAPQAERPPGEDHPEEEGGQRLRLIPILVGSVLILAATPLLALIWGASVADLRALWGALAEGVVIGEMSISPVVFLVFALVFSIGYVLTRGAQRVLRNTILPKTGMSTGGAEALVAGMGYVGVMLAAVVAISSAGIDLSNLALVAGALSVGIGFGLQNIVNNFVSGIILLIERPVKVGDWIDVGGVNGYVRKVNVRSTVIDTFDRSSYILPNSDLISGAVTNFTLTDKVGRVIVPVGVAYGSDTRLVERVLLEIGRGHRMVLSYPGPTAYFMGIGESSLNFELRVMIRDINWMLAVKSELNHQIFARLTEEGVEMPFPQRDLRVRDIGAFAEALAPRGARPPEAPEPEAPEPEADPA